MPQDSAGSAEAVRAKRSHPFRRFLRVSRRRTVHRCRRCGATSPRWVGRCPACAGWNTLVETVPADDRSGTWPPSVGGRSLAGPFGHPVSPVEIGDIDIAGVTPLSTGIAELDRVLSGGLLPGSATLLGGEPGTGKSTLLLQALATMAATGRRCLLVAAEEAAPGPASGRRLGADVVRGVGGGPRPCRRSPRPSAPWPPTLWSLTRYKPSGTPSWPHPRVPGPGPAVCQPWWVAGKEDRCGAGPGGPRDQGGCPGRPSGAGAPGGHRPQFRRRPYLALRVLRAVKHRFGPTGETGLFEMAPAGLVGVARSQSSFSWVTASWGLPGPP